MALKIEKVCTRCHRLDSQTVTSAAAADADEKLAATRQENLAKIKAFVQAIPENERPMLMLFNGKDEVIAHTHLCDGDGPKSSCVNRVDTLLKDLGELPDRGPRKTKTEEEKAAAQAEKDKKAAEKVEAAKKLVAEAEAAEKAKHSEKGNKKSATAAPKA